MELLTGFLASRLGLAVIGTVAGAVMAAAAYYSQKLGGTAKLAEIKDKYPVLDLVVKIASDQLTQTKYGFLFDAAEQIWKGEGFTPEEAAVYAKAMVDNFDLDKYLGTDWDSLDADQIEQGKRIAYTLGLNPE